MERDTPLGPLLFLKYLQDYHINMDTVIENDYCDNCNMDTDQRVPKYQHERDDSHDRYECTQCGWVKYGGCGEWQPPLELDDLD